MIAAILPLYLLKTEATEMDNELQSKLYGYLDFVASQVEEASGVVSSEIPKLAQEYLDLYWWGYAAILVIGLVLLLTAAIIPIIIHRLSKRFGWTRDNWLPPTTCASTLALVVGVIVSLNSIYFLAKVSIAPRVVLVEKIKELAE